MTFNALHQNFSRIATFSFTPLTVKSDSHPTERPPHASIRHRYGLTRLGYHFLFVALFAMIGGSIRGFNLLLVLSGLLISVILVQWRCGRAMIRLADAHRRVPNDVYAGRTFEIHYRLTNRSRWVPIWMLRIKDVIKHLSEKADRQSTVNIAAGVVPQGSPGEASCHCLITSRGRYRFGPIELSTAFPFSLMDSVKRIARRDVSSDIVVYPELVDIHHRWFQGLPLNAGGSGSSAARASGLEGEFFWFA